jgi:Zn-finger protein
MTRCIPCGGSGKVMGGGMLIQNCDSCDGTGKKSAYENAIDKIQHADKNMTRENAKKMFDDELNEVEKKSNKRRK